MKMVCFGPKPWGPSLDDPEMYYHRTPAGMLCARCSRVLVKDDEAVAMLHIGGGSNEDAVYSCMVHHRGCFMHSLGLSDVLQF